MDYSELEPKRRPGKAAYAISIEDLNSEVIRDIQQSEEYYNSELSDQRQQAYYAYYGKALDIYSGVGGAQYSQGTAASNTNKSTYVSRDVFQEVESLKALLLEVFASNQQAVIFSPKAGVTNTLTAIRNTAYCNHTFYDRNNGEQILREYAHDGLLVKMGILKQYWKEQTKKTSKYFEGVTEEELNAFYQNPQGEVIEANLQPDGTYSGHYDIEEDDSFIKVDIVPPENFLVDPAATNIYDFQFMAERRRLYLSDLEEMGLDTTGIPTQNYASDWIYGNEEKMARDSFDGTSDWSPLSEPQTTDKNVVTLYEIYKKVFDGTKTCLYKMFACADTIIHMEKIEKIPYYFWSAFPVPHKFYGMSIADNIMDIQNAKTLSIRQILDNLALTNNPRYEANISALENPEDLIENRIGQIIWTKASSPSIFPMATQPLDPAIFQQIEMLDSMKSETTGNSKLAQGNEQQILQNRTAASLVESMTSSASRRPMLMAKNMAVQLSNMFKDMVELAAKYDKSGPKSLQSPVGPVNVNPAELNIQEAGIQIKVALTPEMQQQEATQLLSFHQIFTQTPQLAAFYGPNQSYLLMQRAMELMGVRGRDLFLLSPASPEYQQAMATQQQQAAQQQQQMQQMAQAEMQFKQQELAIKQQEAQAKIMDYQADNQYDQGKLAIDKRKNQEEFVYNQEKINVEREKLQLDNIVKKAEILTKVAEMKLKEKQGSGI